MQLQNKPIAGKGANGNKNRPFIFVYISIRRLSLFPLRTFFLTLQLFILTNLELYPSVKYMKATRKAFLLFVCVFCTMLVKAQPKRFTDSLSLKVNRVSPLHNDYTTYGFQQAVTGKGVIVGIVDVGFQLNHPAFLDKAGTKNRIVRFWDQSNNAGTAPQGYSYGTLYTDVTKIDYKDYDGTHGTHVAGIAAGSGYGTPNHNQAGNAPDAELVFVQIKYKNDTIPSGARGDYLVANPSIIDAFEYIFKYADSVGKPAVINLSWGMHTGPHDGTSVFDKAVDDLVGQGKVIVGAAGNERGRNMHFGHTFTGDTVSAWIGEAIKRDATYESIYADFWGSASSEFSLQLNLFDTLGNLLGTLPFVSSSLDKDTSFMYTNGIDTLSGVIECVNKSSLNGKPNILVKAYNNHPNTNYVVIRITSANTVLHSWNSGGVDRWTSGGFNSTFKGQQPFSNMKMGNNDYISGENGGTAKGIITVGAYATSFIWADAWANVHSTYALPGYLANFSSQGPTVDGRIKPDVVAPGIMISSALNRYAFDTTSSTYISIIGNDTNYYGGMGGTSMASPQVAGIVALMLQQNPTLTNEQIRIILHNTAVSDTATGTTPNNVYGWGKVDALTALQAVKGTTTIGDVLANNNILVYPNPSKNRFFVDVQNNDNQSINCEITAIDGRKLFESQTTGSRLQIDAEGWAEGVYLLKIESPQGITILKIVKN